MAKGKHHFVPQLYLRAFQSKPKRIHLYNLNRSMAVEDASLRDQCYKRRFYGKTDQTENNLAVLEGCIAPVLQSITSNHSLPPYKTEDYDILLGFVALQVLRTKTAAEQVNRSTDKAMKQIHSRDPRFAEVDMDAVKFGFEDPVLLSLRNLQQMLEAISDLRAHLVVSPRHVFVTSDNPAFKYNQYCEEIQHMGTTGALCRGLQIFVPLCPRTQLVLYDGTTYEVRLSDRTSRISKAAGSDVDKLNFIQLVSADEHVYFSDCEQLKDIQRLQLKANPHRNPDPTVVQEYGQDDDPNTSLLHEYEQTPNVRLGLTFLSLKRRARRVPIEDRAQDYRKQMPLPRLPEPPHMRGRTATFSRFLGRR